jgi:hypothetical protein
VSHAPICFGGSLTAGSDRSFLAWRDWFVQVGRKHSFSFSLMTMLSVRNANPASIAREMVDRRIIDRTPCTGCERPPAACVPEQRPLDKSQTIQILKQRQQVFQQLLEEADGWEAVAERQWMLDDVLIDLEIIEAANLGLRSRNVWLPFWRTEHGYLRRIYEVSHNIPGSSALLNYLEDTNLYDKVPRRPPILCVREVSEWQTTSPVYHEFDLSDLSAIYRHYNILKGATSLYRWPLVIVKEIHPLHIMLLGQLLNLDPSIWIHHMWRDLVRAPSEFGLSLYEHPGASHDGAYVYFDAAKKYRGRQNPANEAFSQSMFYSCLETIATRSLTFETSMPNSLPELAAKLSKAVETRSGAGPLFWSHDFSRGSSGNLDVVVTTSVHGLVTGLDPCPLGNSHLPKIFRARLTA